MKNGENDILSTNWQKSCYFQQSRKNFYFFQWFVLLFHFQRTLEVIDEDGDKSGAGQAQTSRSKRANMVKKALTYFSDKSNRSVSEDNLYTRSLLITFLILTS